LESLGVGVKETNEFNDLKEVRSLADIMKQGFYSKYINKMNDPTKD